MAVLSRIIRSLAAAGVLWTPLPAIAVELADCRPLRLHDEAGRLVSGVEDLAFDRARGRVVLSAHDRHRTDGTGPSDGLYAWPLGDIELQREAVVRLTETPLAVHGIDVRGDTLAAVVREPGATDSVTLFMLDGGAALPTARFEDPRLCRPNDVALLDPPAFLVTNDRGHCSGWRYWRERLLNRPDSFVMAFDEGRAEIFAQGFRFANGVVAADDVVLVAATRGRRVHRLGAAPSELRLPFAPDNITRDDRGAFWTAGPRRLLQFAASINGLWPTAGPSAVARIDPAGRVDLFAMPAGLIDGATAALAVAEKLIVVAGHDDRVVLCRRPDG